MKKTKQAHVVDSLFLLVIFFVFTFCILIVLAMGANTYKQISKNMVQRYDKTTSLAYITTKVRHYDGMGQVFATTFDDTEALALKESVDGVDYVTYIYVYEDKLMELNKPSAETMLTAADGAELLDMQQMKIDFPAPNLLHLTVTFDGGDTEEMWLTLHST